MKKSLHVTSNCIYLFSCICDSTYIGRTERISSTRILEHLPKNLILNGSKLLTSAIGRHILDSEHVDRNQSLEIIARMKNLRLLRFAEALAIRTLCIKKICSFSYAFVNGHALDYEFFNHLPHPLLHPFNTLD